MLLSTLSNSFSFLIQIFFYQLTGVLISRFPLELIYLYYLLSFLNAKYLSHTPTHTNIHTHTHTHRHTRLHTQILNVRQRNYAPVRSISVSVTFTGQKGEGAVGSFKT